MAGKQSGGIPPTKLVSAAEAKGRKPYVCPITRSQFRKLVKSLIITIDDEEAAAQRKSAVQKEFSTGSMGWSLSDKIEILFDGKIIKCQINCNVVICGSKEAD